MRNLTLIILLINSIILTGCAAEEISQGIPVPLAKQNLTTKPMAEKVLQLQITGYENGGRMPAKFATKEGGGDNVSIGVKWQSLPAAQSYALLFDDKHPIAKLWVHWLVVDIPNTVTEITEGVSRTKMPEGSRELMTSWNRTGYDGPQPPVGSGDHEYTATLYALDVPKLDVGANITRSEFLKAIGAHVITQESYSGFFER